MNDKDLRQTSGDNSHNQQALTIKNVYKNYGPSEAQLIESQIEVFRKNMPVLAQAAADLIVERALEFSEKLITEKISNKPELLNAFKDPGMQMASLEAQRQYARTGDKDVFDLLIDLVAERADQTHRNLLQITLDESLEVIPKLTPEHVDALTIIFITKEAHFDNVDTLEALDKFLEEYIKPFCNYLQVGSSCAVHLQYSKCATLVQVNAPSFIYGVSNKILWTYAACFNKGISLSKFIEKYGAIEDYPSEAFMPCLRDDKLIQVVASSEGDLRNRIDHFNLDSVKTGNLINCWQTSMMSYEEAVVDLEKDRPYMRDLNAVYNSIALPSLRLTGVGITIAHANLRRKTKITLDLASWVK